MSGGECASSGWRLPPSPKLYLSPTLPEDVYKDPEALALRTRGRSRRREHAWNGAAVLPKKDWAALEGDHGLSPSQCRRRESAATRSESAARASKEGLGAVNLGRRPSLERRLHLRGFIISAAATPSERTVKIKPLLFVAFFVLFLLRSPP